MGATIVVALVTTPVAGARPGSTPSTTPTASRVVGALEDGEGEPLADIEFRLSFMATQAEVADLAIALWRTGLVESVVAGDPHYRVYLRTPGNLIALLEVRRVLLGHHGVSRVDSLVDVIVRSASR